MTIQRLYIDYSGGNFEYWYYSGGKTYRNRSRNYPGLLKWAKNQGFNSIVLTNEAKERI